MDSDTPRRSRRRWPLLLLLIAGLGAHALTAAWYFTGRHFAGDLSHYAGQLENQLGDITGLDWQLRGLQLTWRGLNPVLSLDSLQARYPAAAAAADQHAVARALLQQHDLDRVLSLGNAEVYVDIFSTLLNRQLMLHGARAAEVVLTVEKIQGGRLQLAGFAARGGAAFDVHKFVNHLQYALVEHIDMRLLDTSGEVPALLQPAALELALHNHKQIRDLQIDTVDALIEKPAAAGQQSGVDPDASTYSALHEPLENGLSTEGHARRNGFSLQARSKGHFLARSSTLKAHFLARGARSSAWLNLFSGAWTVAALDLELWLDKQSFGSVQGHGRVYDAAVARAAPSAAAATTALAAGASSEWMRALSGLAGEMSLRWDSSTDYALAWVGLKMTSQARNLQLPDGSLTVSQDWLAQQRMLVALPECEVRPLIRDVLALNILPARIHQIVNSLDPDGRLHNIEFALPTKNSPTFELHASVSALSTQPWLGAPGVTGLHGQLRLRPREGHFALRSDSELELYFPKLYRQAHHFQRASGDVRWSMQGDRLLVQGEQLALLGRDGETEYGAGFSLNARTKAGTAPSSLRLRVGFTQGELEKMTAFVPYTLPAGLRSWIQQSKASGRVTEGGFIYNGSLQKGDSANRNVQLYFDLEQASAHYAPDWPPVSGLTGTVKISPQLSTVTLNSAELRGVPLRAARIDVHTAGAQHYVEIKSQLSGSVDRALALLQQSPAGDTIRPVIDSWRGRGELRDGKIKLRVPISGDIRAPQQLEFSARLHNTELSMPNLKLELAQVHGPLSYSLARGLQSPGLAARLWGKPWQIKLGATATSNYKAGAANLYVDASGDAEVSAVQQWLRQPVLGFSNGNASFGLQLEHTAKLSELRVLSDLRGIALEGPLPFYKLATQSLPLALIWDLRGAKQPMSLVLPGMLKARFAFEDFDFKGGVVTMTDIAGAVPPAERHSEYQPGTIIFNGSLQQFNLAAWQNALDRYLRFDEAMQEGLVSSTAAPASEPSLRILGEGLQLASGLAFDRQFSSAIVSFSQLKSAWKFDIESDLLKGVVTIPSTAAIQNTAVPADKLADSTAQAAASLNPSPGADNNLPNIPDLNKVGPRIVVDLAYLRMPALRSGLNGSAGRAVASASMDPAGLKPMQVDIEQLYFGEQGYGAWHFYLTSSNNSALAHNIRADYAGLNIHSEPDDGLLWAYNGNGELMSSLHIKLGSERLQEALDTIIKDKRKLPMSAQRLDADLALSWAGAPEDIALPLLNGSMNFTFNKGKFFQASESATGILKLLGLFNFDSLLRRVQLDFTDVYKEGLSFDTMHGELIFSGNRVAFAESPIKVSSPSSKFSLAGAVDFQQSSIDAELVATMPVANNLPWIAALAGGLPVAAGAFIVTRVLGDQFDQLSSAVYSVQGKLDDPQVKFERLFDNKNSKAKEAKR